MQRKMFYSEEERQQLIAEVEARHQQRMAEYNYYGRRINRFMAMFLGCAVAVGAIAWFFDWQPIC
jgi:hypothetical protein